MALVTIWILAVAAAVIFRHVARLTTNLKLSVWLSDGRTAIYFITYIVWGILLRPSCCRAISKKMAKCDSLSYAFLDDCAHRKI